MPAPLAPERFSKAQPDDNLSGTEEDPVLVLAYRRDQRLDGVLAQFLAAAASLGFEGNWHAAGDQIIAKAW